MNDENKFCKYCLDDTNENEQTIIYPCQCSDGVHENCLAIWLAVRSNTNDRYKCEICKTNYIGIVIPPPSPPPSPVRAVTPPPPPEIMNGEEIAEHDEMIAHDDLEEYNEIVDTTISLEFVCCRCYKIECSAYITGTVLSFSAFLMLIGQPYPSQILHYYTGLTVLMIISCVSFVLAAALTGKRYYKRLQEIRTINTIALG